MKQSGRKIHIQTGNSMHIVRKENILHSNGYIACEAMNCGKRANMERVRERNPGCKLETKHDYDFHLNRDDETSRQKGLRKMLNKRSRSRLKQEINKIIKDEI